jgi:hypothetical protein
VAADLTELVPHFRIDEVSLLDSNSLVDIKRGIRIARHRRGQDEVSLDVSGSTNFLWQISDDDPPFSPKLVASC